MQRRFFIKTILFGLIPLTVFPSSIVTTVKSIKSNFKKIYSDSNLKKEFFKFLKNVFNLFPEKDFHKLISEVTKEKDNDKDIYLETQSRLDEITPLFASFSHKLPSLFKQKDEMAKQTISLLGENKKFTGYLEIGSSGRYLDYLEEKVTIEGERYYADGREPGYSLTEMIDRGQICIGAKYIPMTDYKTRYSSLIKKESIDLVTVYIGFHHCPIDLRISFISSIRDTMRMGGKLILRDHDCDTENQKTLVALAHDVFNMGTNESWEYNSNETRNFYSLDFICHFVEKIGFKFEEKTLFQDGDPTKNALMLFTKI